MMLVTHRISKLALLLEICEGINCSAQHCSGNTHYIHKKQEGWWSYHFGSSRKREVVCYVEFNPECLGSSLTGVELEVKPNQDEGVIDIIVAGLLVEGFEVVVTQG